MNVIAKPMIIVCLCLLICGAAAAADLQVLGSFAGEGGGGISPGLLYDQSGSCSGNGPADQRLSDFGVDVQAADDFTVPAGVEWTFTQVRAAGSFFNPNPGSGPIDAVVVQIWDDNAGLPGTMICEEVGSNELADPDIGLTLTGGCAGPWAEGTYWINMMPEMPFVGAGQFAWVPNDSNIGNEFAWQDPAGLTGNPCTSWGYGITTCGIGATFPDMCFAIDGSEAVATTVIEVPTASTIGLLLLLIAIAGAGVYVIRR